MWLLTARVTKSPSQPTEMSEPRKIQEYSYPGESRRQRAPTDRFSLFSFRVLFHLLSPLALHLVYHSCCGPLPLSLLIMHTNLDTFFLPFCILKKTIILTFPHNFMLSPALNLGSTWARTVYKESL